MTDEQALLTLRQIEDQSLAFKYVGDLIRKAQEAKTTLESHARQKAVREEELDTLNTKIMELQAQERKAKNSLEKTKEEVSLQIPIERAKLQEKLKGLMKRVGEEEKRLKGLQDESTQAEERKAELERQFAKLKQGYEGFAKEHGLMSA